MKHHQTSRLEFVTFGVAEIIDGLIRILTFGWLFSNGPLLVSRGQAERVILNRKKARGGFSLVELLVVFVIIGVIVAVVLEKTIVHKGVTPAPIVRVVDKCEYVNIDGQWVHKGDCSNERHY